jgi:hypothetical protein
LRARRAFLSNRVEAAVEAEGKEPNKAGKPIHNPVRVRN